MKLTRDTSMLFLNDTVAWFARRGMEMESVQTDNGH